MASTTCSSAAKDGFKAFKTIGQQEIPAMVMSVDDEDGLHHEPDGEHRPAQIQPPGTAGRASSSCAIRATTKRPSPRRPA
jgi:hypothetical protein